MEKASLRHLPLLSGASSTESIEGTLTPELVIALCGPIGSPLHAVSEYIKKILEESYGYGCETIRLSKTIEEYESASIQKNKADSEAFHKIKELIRKGDSLRERYGNRILADLAVDKIAQVREGKKRKTDMSQSVFATLLIRSKIKRN